MEEEEMFLRRELAQAVMVREVPGSNFDPGPGKSH
jgi:hypothetical protein